MAADDDALEAWAQQQRALARALNISIEVWMDELEAAGARSTSLTAAVVGASMANGLGLSVLDRLDGPKLAAQARALVDPAPPRVTSPVLAEAIRRSAELPTAGAGARRLKRAAPDDRGGSGRPERVETQPLPSSDTATPDAPGSTGDP